MRVAVYYNLHLKCLSVKALEGPNKGRVIDLRYIVYLRDVTFKVSEAGRQRVLREGRKNVHAFVIGTLDDAYAPPFEGTMITYNPRRFSSFVRTHDYRPVTRADRVRLFKTYITAQGED